nr:hypothetical protein CcurKRNrm2_p058 [Cryptomonas curvata]
MKNFRNNKLYKSRSKQKIKNNKFHFTKTTYVNVKQPNFTRQPNNFFEKEENIFLFNNLFGDSTQNKIKSIKPKNINYNNLKKSIYILNKNNIYFNSKTNKNIFKFSFFRKII